MHSKLFTISTVAIYVIGAYFVLYSKYQITTNLRKKKIDGTLRKSETISKRWHLGILRRIVSAAAYIYELCSFRICKLRTQYGPGVLLCCDLSLIAYHYGNTQNVSRNISIWAIYWININFKAQDNNI